jgi:hypothetical protein
LVGPRDDSLVVDPRLRRTIQREGVVDATRESIPGALSLAGRLPSPQGMQLLDASHQAFTTALTVVAAVSVIVFVGWGIWPRGRLSGLMEL